MERFHQTLKLYLAKVPGADTIGDLQAQIDRFLDYYNQVRPHRAKERMTPQAAFDARDKAVPSAVKITGLGKEWRVRHDKIDKSGCFILHYRSRLYHVGVGRAFKGRQIIVFVAGRNIGAPDRI